MARKPLPPAELIVDPSTPAPQGHQQFLADEAEVKQMEIQALDNATALADRLGYEGALTIGALEDEIRFYQRRTVEACLELGKRLLVMKELTGHGEFQQRVDLLGISQRMAQKFMASTLKFSNASPAALLAVGNQAKLLELLVLDDCEIEALENGESARGLRLDDIESMSRNELRAALKEAVATSAARDDVIKRKESKISELEVRAASAERRQADFSDIEKRDYECAPLHDTINESMMALAKMATQVKHLVENVGGELVTEECFHAVLLPIKRALEIANFHRLHIDLATLFDEQFDAPLEALQARAAGLPPEALQ